MNACWAIPILMGLKTWEIRSQNALKRGTIYIALSGLSEIWGEVTLTDSHKPSASEWNHSSLKHRIAHRSDPSSPHPPFVTQPWAWHFTCARLYESPVPASRPKGPVVWTTFTPVVLDSGPAMDEAIPMRELPPPPPTSPPDDNADGTNTIPRGPAPPRTDNTAPTDPRTPEAASPDTRGHTTLPPVPRFQTDARARLDGHPTTTPRPGLDGDEPRLQLGTVDQKRYLSLRHWLTAGTLSTPRTRTSKTKS